MSNSTILDAPKSSVKKYEERELTPERRDQLIAHAKGVLAGRIEAVPLPIVPEVLDFLRRDLADKSPPPTAKAIKFQSEHMSLDRIYDGTPVLCHTTPKGVLTVLAEGVDEIYSVIDALTGEERSQVIIEYTGLFMF
jgi:hypothetical protein